jgi:hypothetical protein
VGPAHICGGRIATGVRPEAIIAGQEGASAGSLDKGLSKVPITGTSKYHSIASDRTLAVGRHLRESTLLVHINVNSSAHLRTALR